MSFYKGDLVRFAITDEISNYKSSPDDTVWTHRPSSQEERDRWYKSDASKGMTAGGETKLPPQATAVMLSMNTTMTVLRGRCRVRLDWGNPKSGYVKVMCNETTKITYVKRDWIEHARSER